MYSSSRQVRGLSEKTLSQMHWGHVRPWYGPKTETQPSGCIWVSKLAALTRKPLLCFWIWTPSKPECRTTIEQQPTSSRKFFTRSGRGRYPGNRATNFKVPTKLVHLPWFRRERCVPWAWRLTGYREVSVGKPQQRGFKTGVRGSGVVVALVAMLFKLLRVKNLRTRRLGATAR